MKPKPIILRLIGGPLGDTDYRLKGQIMPGIIGMPSDNRTERYHYTVCPDGKTAKFRNKQPWPKDDT